MGLGRARAAALLVAGMLAPVLALSAGVGSPATATGRTAPSVSLRTVGTDAVVVSGRTATASAKVRIDRRVGSAWVRAARARAHHHRYSITLTVAAGNSWKFRATSNRRSRTFVVRMPARTGAAPAVSPQAAKPPPTLYDACGARPRKADGAPWSCTFHDDFDGTALDETRWIPQTEGFVTGDLAAGFACYSKSPDNVSVARGMLSLTVRKEAVDQPCGSSGLSSPYTSGSVSTYGLFSQQYGRFEARIRNTASSVAGLHEAFWLWPDEQATTVDPNNTGEIDISETYSQYNAISVPYLHYAAAPQPAPGVNTAWDCAVDRGVWNTYTLEWTPTTIAISVNGRTCLTNTSADPVFHKPYIVLLTQALGAGTNALTAETPVPATMDIDYVRVWK